MNKFLQLMAVVLLVSCGDDPRNKHAEGGAPGDGIYKEYHSDGSLSLKGKMKNGKLQGEVIFYGTDAIIIKTISYKDGIEDGPYEHYFPDGVIKLKGLKKMGGELGPREEFYSNGLRKESRKYIYTFKDTTVQFKSWYSNGHIEKEFVEKNGKLEGSYNSWHKNEQQRVKAEYLGGEKHGLYMNWKSTGELYDSSYFFLGEKVKDEQRFIELRMKSSTFPI